MLPVLAALLLGADTFATPCVSPTWPARGAALFELKAGASLSEVEGGEPGAGFSDARTVCSDTLAADVTQRRVWFIFAGVALYRFVSAADLAPRPKTAWRSYRYPEEELGQTGCLKRFKKGTWLFDAPDGTAVAMVVDAEAFLGKWENQKSKSGDWAGVPGFRAELVWVKQPSDKDWCP